MTKQELELVKKLISIDDPVERIEFFEGGEFKETDTGDIDRLENELIELNEKHSKLKKQYVERFRSGTKEEPEETQEEEEPETVDNYLNDLLEGE